MESALVGIWDCRAADLRVHQGAHGKWRSRVSEVLSLIWNQVTWMVWPANRPKRLGAVITAGRWHALTNTGLRFTPYHRGCEGWADPV